MPPSALARLTDLEIESPWTFELSAARNPSNKTHAGVLEFIAEEGNVHLPAWVRTSQHTSDITHTFQMMKQLELEEGGPIKISGAVLPKGKFTKLQAQTTDFLEISDHKTVLERALRNFSTLSKGDYIEILHNCITFELFVMEIDPEPDSQSIFIIDTDLEVDFAPPKGYVEPAPRPREPQPTMASKMKIDTRAQEDSPISSRPNSAVPEVFKGSGQTLGGRKTKGKGLAKPIEKVDDTSKISRTEWVLKYWQQLSANKIQASRDMSQLTHWTTVRKYQLLSNSLTASCSLGSSMCQSVDTRTKTASHQLHTVEEQVRHSQEEVLRSRR